MTSIPPTNASGARRLADLATGGRIWIVDDSPLQLKHTTGLLSRGYVLESFSNGEEILERLDQQGPPDLLLLDWELPGLSGVEACRFIREKYDETTLPILMLTGRDGEEDTTACLAAGANDYVAKPYNDAILRARVRTLLRTRQQAQALREREAWLSTTLTSIGDAVITTDGKGFITFLNRVAERLTGWASAEVQGEPLERVFRIIDERTRQPAKGPVDAILLSGQGHALAGPTLLVRRDGSDLPIEDSAAPIRDEAGRLSGVVLVFRDVSERRSEEQAAQRRAEFEQQLIGIVSHDLRNPLSAILLASTMLTRRDDLDDRATKNAVRIKNAAERATRMVNDLLDFTQARLGGGLNVTPRPADLQAVTRAVLDEVEAAWPGREIKAAHAGAPQGEWDPDRLGQVVQNLVTNALKYSPDGSAVSVTTGVEGAHAYLSVHNAGTPIDPGVLQTIFEPLRRGTTEIDRTGRSVGLGLYIVKQIVSVHGGEVAVTSSAAEGTTFTVRVPLARG